MNNDGLEKFLAENGDRPTAELLKDRPSNEAVERLGRGWAEIEDTTGVSDADNTGR